METQDPMKTESEQYILKSHTSSLAASIKFLIFFFMTLITAWGRIQYVVVMMILMMRGDMVWASEHNDCSKE